MRDKEIENFLASAKDEDVIDGVIEVLKVVQQLLDPHKMPENRDFCGGMAINEVVHASKVLQAYRKKKFGNKGITTL